VLRVRERIKTWNELLRSQVTEFGTSYTQATVLLFSAHQLLTDVLDDPLEYGLVSTSERSAIWSDDLHLTAGVHNILGSKLLSSIPC
jgi:phospholipase/lecithinase/hemolysin